MCSWSVWNANTLVAGKPTSVRTNKQFFFQNGIMGQNYDFGQLFGTNVIQILRS